ncbi:MAG: flagellar brake protein [Betaproteobacteria bacterium]|nr:flagellar brake protein [Betaproteobacteria bacterium]
MQGQVDISHQASGSEFERYQVYSRFEIVSLLREVADSHALVTVYFNQGAEFIVTNLLDVNPEFEELIFDLGADDNANRRLLRSERMTAVTFLDHIKLQFSAQHAELTEYEHLPAIRIRLPESLLRLQRRNFFRIRTPVARPILVAATHPLEPGRKLNFRVGDLSCGGVALVAGEGEAGLETGMALPDVRIELPEAGRLMVALEVRNVREHEEGVRRTLRRYGCQFLGLAPSLANSIQRYITRIQRERNPRA